MTEAEIRARAKTLAQAIENGDEAATRDGVIELVTLALVRLSVAADALQAMAVAMQNLATTIHHKG
jgi:hypothetical protein